MRAGKSEGVFWTRDVSEQEISKLMVGRDVVLKYDKINKPYGTPILSVNELSLSDESGKALLEKVAFKVRSGEIVGIAGVEGNGQTQLVEALTGRLSVHRGSIAVKGTVIQGYDIGRIRSLGVSYIPEDRMRQGAAKEASISDNLISTQYRSKEMNSGLFLKGKTIGKLAAKLIEDFRVRCSGPAQPIGMLSGGNMQKVVVARECSTSPDLLIAEQPTRGVDVGAAQFIHQKLIELRDNGSGVLLISADLNEILELSDSLLVMYEGQIVAYLEEPSKVTEEELGLYMLGLQRQDDGQIRRAVES
jgi:simple sugar transport system ATP-binding protein